MELKNPITERFKVSKERLDVCETCDQFNSEKKICRECGCQMTYKTLFPWANCPLGKWKATKPTNN